MRNFTSLILAAIGVVAFGKVLIAKQDSLRAPEPVVAEAPAQSAPVAMSAESMPMRDAVASKFIVPGYASARLPTLSAADQGLLGEPKKESKK